MQNCSTQTGIELVWTSDCNIGSDADRRMVMARDVSVSELKHFVIHVHALNKFELTWFVEPREKAKAAQIQRNVFFKVNCTRL